MDRATDCSGETNLGHQIVDVSLVTNVLSFAEFHFSRAARATTKAPRKRGQRGTIQKELLCERRDSSFEPANSSNLKTPFRSHRFDVPDPPRSERRAGGSHNAPGKGAL
jgi:hypothetical protein